MKVLKEYLVTVYNKDKVRLGAYTLYGESYNEVREKVLSRSNDDEMLFIVIHQAYELWFKQMLHEIAELQKQLERGDTHRSLAILGRVRTIMKTCVGQLDILETMTPLEFQSFRARLEASSGFQSDQFRQLEFLLGKKTPQAIERFASDTRARAALERRFAALTLWDAFLRYLARQGYVIPSEQLTRDVTQPVTPSEPLQDTLIDLYRRDPKHAEMCERLVDLDEGLKEWRYRHVKMVQRTIGAKAGTGGSSGAQYLATTLMTPLFPDLWEIRSRL